MKIENDLITPTQNAYSATLSIPDRSDIISGQVSYIDIIVKKTSATGNLDNIKKVTIAFSSNVAQYFTWKTDSEYFVGLDYAITKIHLIVSDNIAIKNQDVTFSIHLWSDKSGTVPVADYTPESITYSVKEISQHTQFVLHTDNEYIQPPTTENQVGKGSVFIPYSSLITDNKGKILKNVQILVSSSLPDQIYSDNPDNTLVNIGTEDTSSSPIKTARRDGLDYFIISSNPYGYIKFRVYPKKDISARIDFKTGILGVTSFNYAGSAYIFSDDNNSDDPFGPSSPNIYNIEQSGKLQKMPGSKGMKVGISPYDGFKNTDAFIFFMKGYENNDKPIQLTPIYNIDSIDNLNGYPFDFSYDQLPLNKIMALYYLIAPVNQDSLYSMKSDFTYVGDLSDGSNKNDNGLYTRVEVYSSYSPNHPNFDPNNSNNDRMYDNRLVTLDTINQYTKNITITQQAPTGLYVVIRIAKNSQDEVNGLPPLNSTCILTINIDSATRQENKSYPSVVLSDKQKYYHVAQIPYCDLTRADSWDDGIQAKLSFTYSITYAGVTKNSKEWKATIGTANTAFNIDEDGCPKNKH
ncbi:hypothetical protein [Xenorhabdus sp. PB62.4]|uniref:hypothetical protein n=1 Tax=Xenorhabdus sp. PB62.4 TaxID=1851573 RepID=UPI001656EC3D|nr:hypothetical protein [Xenorhabdus sp. PB62.4]MBC8953526.1 hypothetical protein [Xenorhabdus sp. PB62.4]